MSFDPDLTSFVSLTVLASLGMGALLISCPRLVPLPASARFLCGASLAPHAIGLLILMLFASVPGISWGAVHVSVLSASLLALWAGRDGARWLLRGLSRCRLRTVDPLKTISALALALLLTAVIARLSVNASAPLIAFDALQYAREAMPLGAWRSMEAWVGHTGNISGTLRGDIHHPIFPAYLSWAQQFTSGGMPGLPDDLALRWAFQVSLVSLLVALPLGAISMRWRGWSIAAIPLVLLVPQFALISDSATRDAFRLVPLVAILALLLRLGVLPMTSSRAIRILPALSVLSMLALMSHTLNGVVLVLTVAGWGCWMVCVKAFRTLVWGGVAVAVGLSMGAWTYLDAWMATGSIHGSGVMMYGALADSPMLDVIRRLEVADLKGVKSLTQRVVEMVMRDGRGFALSGLVVSVGILTIGVYSRHVRESMVFGAAVVAVFVALPVVGLFDIAGYQVSQWFVTNQRYLLHWYVFLMFPLLGALSGLDRVLQPSLVRWFRACVICVLCLLCYQVTLERWYQNLWGDDFIAARIDAIREAASKATPSRLVLEDARWNYYLGNHHVVMYSTPTSVLFRARTFDEFDQAFRTLDAAGVVLVASSLPTWWNHGRVLPYLEQRACRTDIGDTGLVIFVLRTARPGASCR